MSGDLMRRLLRRAVVLTATFAVIGIAVGTVKVAADWRAASAPLDVAPVGMDTINAQLVAETDRAGVLSDQVGSAADQIATLKAALLEASDHISSDAQTAAQLREQLAAATSKLDTLQGQLKAAQTRLAELNKAAARQAAANAAAPPRRRPAAPEVVSTMTTERILPAVALPVPGRLRPDGPATRADSPARHGAHARAVTARTATARWDAWLTTPARAGMLLGASAAIYAVTLAGIAGLQAQGDAELVARHQPYVEALARARAANDALAAALDRTDADLRTVGASYASTGASVSDYEARLDALAALVAEVQGSAAALPTRISLPRVTVTSSGSRPPRTSTTTGASGVP